MRKGTFLFCHSKNSCFHYLLDQVIMMYLVWSLIILIFLSRCSSVIRYHVKFICFCLYHIFLTGVSSVFAFLNPGNSKNIYVAQSIVRNSGMEWLFGFNIKYENLDILKDVEKPVVLVSNHQTIIDPYILFKIVPNNTTVIAKKSLLYVPIFGFVCWLYGVFFIDRSKHSSALETMKSIGEKMKKEKTNVVIFAEGTRSQNEKLQNFKKGAFHLSIQAQVPIVPIVIGNYRNVIDRKNKLFEGGKIRVKILPPIQADGLTSQDVDDLVNKVHQIMSNAFSEDSKVNADVYKDVIPLKVD